MHSDGYIACVLIEKHTRQDQIDEDTTFPRENIAGFLSRAVVDQVVEACLGT